MSGSSWYSHNGAAAPSLSQSAGNMHAPHSRYPTHQNTVPRPPPPVNHAYTRNSPPMHPAPGPMAAQLRNHHHHHQAGPPLQIARPHPTRVHGHHQPHPHGHHQMNRYPMPPRNVPGAPNHPLAALSGPPQGRPHQGPPLNLRRPSPQPLRTIPQGPLSQQQQQQGAAMHPNQQNMMRPGLPHHVQHPSSFRRVSYTHPAASLPPPQSSSYHPIDRHQSGNQQLHRIYDSEHNHQAISRSPSPPPPPPPSSESLKQLTPPSLVPSDRVVSDASGSLGPLRERQNVYQPDEKPANHSINNKASAADMTADAASILLELAGGRKHDENDGGLANQENQENQENSLKPTSFGSQPDGIVSSGSTLSSGSDDTTSTPDLSNESAPDLSSEPSSSSEQVEDDLPAVVPENFPTRLALPHDESKLNSLHCFLRSELLEIFVVKKSPNKSPTHSPGSSVGRVGLRCVHCALARRQRDDRDEAPMAVFYPKSIAEIYRLVTSWQRCHLRKCRSLPPPVRAKWQCLRENDKSRGKTHYWVTSAKEIGLVDCQSRAGGIRFGPGMLKHTGTPPIPEESPVPSETPTPCAPSPKDDKNAIATATEVAS